MAHGPGPLLLLLSLLFGAASDRIKVVTVHPGDNVTLNCTAPDHSIIAVVWTRSDLEPEYVLYYSDEHLDPTKQHPSFKDRVDLVDRDLKDGDVSLILKNVSSNDNGTYECRVASKRTDLDSEPITIIRLQVTDSDGLATN
ncbi:myelin protein zero-like protein 2 [Perca fluviatilis]|uniref:myelin protein zero-like protein 2 n=1 Tax=Perca fluviatilis TaxID=8168 RepID=UPI0019666505|nr:myelin protein zero-like protein 2 [Perca fluviatilis]